MKVTLTASTAEKIVVWKEDDLYHARRLEAPERPQVCLAVDLFEVIAELAGLDLEQATQAAEATTLSKQAQAGLKDVAVDGPRAGADANQSATRDAAP